MWCWHKYSRWHGFTFVDKYRRVVDGLPEWHEVRTPMQEKHCSKCGKTRQRKV